MKKLLGFQLRIEALHRLIVVVVAGSTHRGCHAEPLQHLPVLRGTVVTALVRVVHQPGQRAVGWPLTPAANSQSVDSGSDSRIEASWTDSPPLVTKRTASSLSSLVYLPCGGVL